MTFHSSYNKILSFLWPSRPSLIYLLLPSSLTSLPWAPRLAAWSSFLFFEYSSSCFSFSNIYNFFKFPFGSAGSLLLHRLFSSCGAWASHCGGFSCFGAQALKLWLVDSVVVARRLWSTSLVAPWHMGSSRIRDRTRVFLIGRQIIYHWVTMEAQAVAFQLSLNAPSEKSLP